MDEYEEIPWSTLLSEHQQGRTKTLYLAATVIVAVVVGFVGIRWLTSPGHGDGGAVAAQADTTTVPGAGAVELPSVSPFTVRAPRSQAPLTSPACLFRRRITRESTLLHPALESAADDPEGTRMEPGI